MADTTSSAPKPKVLVCGDLAVDWIDSPVPPASQEEGCWPADAGHHNWRLRPGTKRVGIKGGAWLPAEIVRRVLGDDTDVAGPPSVKRTEDLGPEDCVQSYLRADRFKKDLTKKDSNEESWRLKEYCGFEGPAEPSKKLETLYGDSLKNISIPAVELLILDDAANGFRASDVLAGQLAPLIGKETRAVVHKVTRPLDPPPCRKEHATFILWKKIRQACAKNRVPIVVVIDANDLRADCAQISRGLSWERSSWDIMRHFQGSGGFICTEANEAIPKCWLVVKLGLEGALILPPGWAIPPRESDEQPSLVYDRLRAEDDFGDHVAGNMVGYSAVFTAALGCSILKNPGDMIERLTEGSIMGLTGARALLEHGFRGKDAAEEYPINQVSQLLHSGDKHKDLHSTIVPELDGPVKQFGACWSMVSNLGLAKIEKAAIEIVKSGMEAASPIPVAQFDKFTAITLSEIESYRTIQRIIREYRDAGVLDRPLCIGVFGRPGSGKSYGVKMVVGQILGDKVPSMTFNLSEFREISELSRAFHIIHNKTRDGAVPLVFFDEFDCSVGNDSCGWLKYFLAPMQDGVFNDGVDTHPIGRAIFVFAGGTCYDYRQFAGQSKASWFINAKGPDFLSRLRGYIDIAGTEPTDPRDHSCMLRRAIMLRVNLELRSKTLGGKAHRLLGVDNQIRIDHDVLRAFLNVHSYHNSVRSMTGIIETSELSSSRGFTRAALPPDAMLNMYTDAGSFSKLVNLAPNEELTFLPAREELAQLVHARYCKRNSQSDTAIPWAELNENNREQNRLQVDRMVEYLSKIGCTVELIELGKASYNLTKKDILEVAKLEHERWYRDKEAQGYRLGKNKDDVEMTHPDMKHWDELSKSEQQKDIDAMGDIPFIMARVGLCVVRR